MMIQSSKHLKVFMIVSLMILFFLVYSGCNVSTSESTSDVDRQLVITPEATPLPTPAPTIEYIGHPSFPTPPPAPDWTPELEQLKVRLLGGDCSSPCWFGIKPNVTPADEVPDILNQLKEQGILSHFDLIRHPISSRYDISFEAGGGRMAEGGGFVGRITIDEKSNLVTTLGIGSRVKFISLGDIIEEYGSPILVADGAGESFNGIYLAYPEKEIFLWARTDSFDENMITPDMNVTTLSFLSSTSPNHPLQSPNIDWFEWEGYRNFNYYYQKFREAEQNK